MTHKAENRTFITLSPPNEKEFSRIQFHIKTSVNVTKNNNNKNNPLCASDWKVQENVISSKLFRPSLCLVAMKSVLTASVVYHQESQNLPLRTWSANPLPPLRTIFRDRSPLKCCNLLFLWLKSIC